MATINLGSIKFKWKGTYNGATAYTVDDVVEYNGSSYICILASTGNLPTDTTYFEQMSQKGTNGTDLLSISGTVQGDIYYNNGSAIARLPAGSANQVLQSGGTGANPSWGTVSSDFVKLGTGYSASGSASLSIDGYFSSEYETYKLFASGTNPWVKVRLNFGGTAYTGSNYVWTLNYSARNSSGGSTSHDGDWNVDYIPGWYWDGDSVAEHGYVELTIQQPQDTSNRAKSVMIQGQDYNSTDVHTYTIAGYLDGNNYNTACTGFTFFRGTQLLDFSWSLYGIK